MLMPLRDDQSNPSGSSCVREDLVLLLDSHELSCVHGLSVIFPTPPRCPTRPCSPRPIPYLCQAQAQTRHRVTSRHAIPHSTALTY